MEAREIKEGIIELSVEEVVIVKKWASFYYAPIVVWSYYFYS